MSCDFEPGQVNSFVLYGTLVLATFVPFIIKDRDEKGARNAILKETNIIFKTGCLAAKQHLNSPYREPSAKPNLVLQASAIVWNSTIISFTLATILGRALRHLLQLQFQVITVAFLQKETFQTLIKLSFRKLPWGNQAQVHQCTSTA